MKKAIFVITLTLVALVIAGSTISCTRGTPTSTPGASKTIDLIGVWSGTNVRSGPGHTTYYNVVMTVTNIDGMQVWGTIAFSHNRTEGQVFVATPNWAIPLNGQLSGSTLTFQIEGDRRESDQHVQVSGNSMTGSGTVIGIRQGQQTEDWSWNLTRVR